MDSRSRISPTSRTSGSSRSADRNARSNEGLSTPTSRWVTADKLCVWTYSTGSSMVRMWSDRVSLMRAMIEARVVDFPEPVGPVIRTSPRGSRAIHSATGGRPSSSKCRDVRWNHPKGECHLASLVERAATKPGPIEPGEGEVHVLVLVRERAACSSVSMLWTISSISPPDSSGGAIDTVQTTVDPDPRRRAGNQE